MDEHLLSIIVCPMCKNFLEYKKDTEELYCKHDRIFFPVRNGIPVLLKMDARKLSDNERV